MTVAEAPEFSQLTSIAVGGRPRVLLSPPQPQQLVEAARETWSGGEEWMFLGGGSNLVVSDDGFEGTVIRVVTSGIEPFESLRRDRLPGAPSRLRVQAGERWDDVVAYTVEQGWSGIETLSGIPGSSGAAPIQNIGAYGQELSSSLIAVDFLDYLTGQRQRVPASELGLGYRTSALKQGRRGLVISIDLGLTESVGALSEPVRYAQLASALGVSVGARVPLAELRTAVLALRAAKGMLLSAEDPDSVSAGSFFTNPIVSENFARGLPADAPRWPITPEQPPAVAPLPEYLLSVPRDSFRSSAVSDSARVARPATMEARITRPATTSEYLVKLSAAWLIEHSGIRRGFSLPGSKAAVSSKHTLALVNTGGATADQVAELARYVRSCVLNEFGVRLQPEPALVGLQL